MYKTNIIWPHLDAFGKQAHNDPPQKDTKYIFYAGG